MKVYAVQYSNYEPAEIDSLWERREDAQARADRLNERRDFAGWDVAEWTVYGPADNPVDAVVDAAR